MSLSQHCKYYNHVSSIRTSTSTLSLSSARRRASTPALHPTSICLILTIASTHFLTCFEQSEATSNTTTHPPALASLSLLFSMLGALSGALSAGRTRHPHQPAFVDGPGWPTSANIHQSHVNTFLPDLPSPRWVIQRMWDLPSACALASLICVTAQVWLYVCIYEPCSVQVVGGFAAAATLMALRRLWTSPLSSHELDKH